MRRARLTASTDLQLCYMLAMSDGLYKEAGRRGEREAAIRRVTVPLCHCAGVCPWGRGGRWGDTESVKRQVDG
jgi:hypothetical protein